MTPSGFHSALSSNPCESPVVNPGALAIPGLGPFIAAGPLLAALSGAAAGATGGVSGALVGMGIPEIEAKRYEGKIKGGNILISVHTENSDMQKRAEEIFKTARAHDICATNEASVPKPAHHSAWAAQGAMADDPRSKRGTEASPMLYASFSPREQMAAPGAASRQKRNAPSCEPHPKGFKERPLIRQASCRESSRRETSKRRRSSPRRRSRSPRGRVTDRPDQARRRDAKACERAWSVGEESRNWEALAFLRPEKFDTRDVLRRWRFAYK